MFFYVDADGSRTISLLECKPGARYRVLSTVDMKSWRTLATLNIGPDGTASCSDITPEPHAFYRVVPLGVQR